MDGVKKSYLKKNTVKTINEYANSYIDEDNVKDRQNWENNHDRRDVSPI